MPNPTKKISKTEVNSPESMSLAIWGILGAIFMTLMLILNIMWRVRCQNAGAREAAHDVVFEL